MEQKNRENFIRHLLEFKRAMRACIQNGGNEQEMKEIADKYGFKFATPI